MLKLGSALGAWRPAEGRSPSDPLALIAAGWSEIVGAEVAASSAPLRVSAGTLLVATRSSAWSQQLSFLSERVIDAIAARLPSAGIERLRFRVGKLPVRTSGRPAASGATRRGAARPLPEASADAFQALARFERTVRRSQGARRAAGWSPCSGCGSLCEPVALAVCAACRAAREAEREAATARLLFEAPWLGFAGTAALVDGLWEEEYERIRSRLLRRWWRLLEQTRAAGRISRGGRERLVASSYVVLRSKLPPEAIRPATVRAVLGDALHDLLYTDERMG